MYFMGNILSLNTLKNNMAFPKKYSKKIIKRIILLYDIKKLSAIKINKILKIPVPSLYVILRRNKIKLRTCKKYSDKIINKITKLYNNNLFAIDISKITGIPVNTIYSLINKSKITKRSRSLSTRLMIKQGRRAKRPFARATKFQKIVRCRKCGFVFEPSKKSLSEKCINCGNIIDARDRKRYAKKYAKNNNINATLYLKRWNKKNNSKKRKREKRKLFRKSVLFRLGGINPKCVNCGCDDFRLLEVNHKNCGGAKEIRTKGSGFYGDIINGKRKIEDLELLCRVCNALHFLQFKYGKLPFKISWNA